MSVNRNAVPGTPLTDVRYITGLDRGTSFDDAAGFIGSPSPIRNVSRRTPLLPSMEVLRPVRDAASSRPADPRMSSLTTPRGTETVVKATGLPTAAIPGGSVVFSSSTTDLTALSTGYSSGPTYLGALQKFLKGMPSSGLDHLKTRYDIASSQQLGYGRHSHVIQVRSKTGGRKEYAVKVLALAESDDAKVRRELTAMAEVTHSNTSLLVDALQCSEQLPNVRSSPPYICIVMEQIVDAEALSNIIRRSGGSTSLTWKVLKNVTSALAEMHRLGFVHRDVWTENILVDSAGAAYLIDFGCTESWRKPSGLPADTGLNIPYLSPQAATTKSMEPSDDMWAVGLVLTEVITGIHIIFRMGRHDIPFFTQQELLQAALDEAAAQGGPVLGDICRRLLSQNASSRATANDIFQICSQQSIGSSQSMTAPFGPSRYQATTKGASVTYQATVDDTHLVRSSKPRYVKDSMAPNSAETMFLPGQQVTYQASSHNGYYQATIVGRVAGRKAWSVKVFGGGSKEVADEEVWRLRPKVDSS